MTIATQSTRKPSRVYLRRGHPLGDGLPFAYPFFANAGSTLRDVSGRQHHGTINGPDWVNGPIGPSLDFDKTNSEYVNIPENMVTGSESRTAVFFLKPRGLANIGAGMDHYFITIGNTATGERWSFGNDSGSLRFEIEGTGEVSDISLNTTSYWMVACSQNGTNFDDVTVFARSTSDNGFASYDMTSSATIDTTSGQSAIGVKADNDASRPFNGVMTIALLYDWALKEPQLNALWRNPLLPFITKPR